MPTREEIERAGTRIEMGHRIVLDARDHFEICLHPPCFLCKNCNSLVGFKSKVWHCIECDLEMTNAEALFLIDLGRKSLDVLEHALNHVELVPVKKKRSLWHWLRSLLR